MYFAFLVKYTLMMKNQLDATLGMFKMAAIAHWKFQKVHISASRSHRTLSLMSQNAFLMHGNVMH